MRLARRPSKKGVLAALMLASAILLAVPAHYSRWICHVFQPLLAPLGKAGMYLTTGVRARVSELAGRTDAGADAEQVAFLTAVRQQLQTKDETIAELRQWRAALEGFPCKLIDASVVGAEPLGLRDRRLLDAGAADGAADGDLVTTRRLLHPIGVALPEHLTVLGRNYVAGRIIRPGAHTATLQLVTDPKFQMPAMLWRIVHPGGKRAIYEELPDGGRVRTEHVHDGRPGPYPVGDPPTPVPVLVQGDGRRIVLRDVPARHGILAGDIVTTSRSTELLLPFGLTIGRVARTEPDKQDPHAVTVFVDPLANLATLRRVYVVMPLDRAGGAD